MALDVSSHHFRGVFFKLSHSGFKHFLIIPISFKANLHFLFLCHVFRPEFVAVINTFLDLYRTSFSERRLPVQVMHFYGVIGELWCYSWQLTMSQHSPQRVAG